MSGVFFSLAPFRPFIVDFKLSVCYVSCAGNLMNFRINGLLILKNLNIFQPLLFKYVSSVPFTISSPLGTLITSILYYIISRIFLFYLKLSQIMNCLLILFFFVCLFFSLFLCVTENNFHCYIFKFTNLLLQSLICY